MIRQHWVGQMEYGFGLKETIWRKNEQIDSWITDRRSVKPEGEILAKDTWNRELLAWGETDVLRIRWGFLRLKVRIRFDIRFTGTVEYWQDKEKVEDTVKEIVKEVNGLHGDIQS